MSDRPLAGRRLYFVGIGGAGLSAYANFARAWGAEVRGWDVARDDLPRGARGDRSRPRRRAVAARRVRGRRLGGARGPHRRPLSRGVPRRARRAAPLDRRRRRPRQDDDGGDGRVRPARARPRPGVDRRRRRAAARRQRGRRARAGSSSRATSRTARSALLEPEIARGDERRARSPRDVRVRGGARRLLRGVARAGAAGRARLGARARPMSRSRSRASTTGERRRCARGARARRCRPRATPSARLAGFAGVGRQVRARRRARWRPVFDDYGHNPTEIAATLAHGARARATAARRRLPAARVRAHATAFTSSAPRSASQTRRS